MTGKAKRFAPEEVGAIRKPDTGGIHVALVYPNRYSLGMSSLGFQAVYALFNTHPNVFCERAFYPEPDAPENARIRTLETQRPISDVDIIAFSISFSGPIISMAIPNLIWVILCLKNWPFPLITS